MRVYFTPSRQDVIDQAINVRIRDVDVITVCVDLEPVQFQKGFYSVNMTFFFDVKLDVFLSPGCAPASICGLSIFNKKVILYGSEGNVKIYSSDLRIDENDDQNIPVMNLPKASVQVAEPIGLAARVCACPKKCCKPCCNIPECICNRYGGEFSTDNINKAVYVTIGIFTIVQIERNVQMLVPSYDFCIPQKECVDTTDNPCELFSRLDFPTDEFFPPRAGDSNDNDGNSGSCGCGCGCGHR